MIRSLLLGAAALATCASAAPVLIPANSSSVAWVGRRIYTDQGVSFDWEGVQASITIANATFVGCQILDAATGGARFAVVYNNSMMWPAAQRTGTGSSSSGVSDPDPGHNEVPGLRVATLVTSPYQSLYTLGAGESISGMTGTWSLTLLTEPQFVGDISPNQTLTLVGFVTDGVVLEPPAGSPGRRSRRLTFLGDSLTAGYGSGFDIPTGAVCGGGVLQDDVTYSYGAVLCSSAVFNADCDWAAVSGITLTRPTDLPDLWPYAMGSALQHWPKGTWPLWNFSSFVPDAVVINLDEYCCRCCCCYCCYLCTLLPMCHTSLTRPFRFSFPRLSPLLPVHVKTTGAAAAWSRSRLSPLLPPLMSTLCRPSPLPSTTRHCHSSSPSPRMRRDKAWASCGHWARCSSRATR